MPSLPFSQTCSVKKQDGTIVASGIPISPVWPANGSHTDIGQQFDHQAEAAMVGLAALSGTNRSVVIGSKTYRVVEAIPNDFLPHVALFLRIIVPGGGSGS